MPESIRISTYLHSIDVQIINKKKQHKYLYMIKNIYLIHVNFIILFYYIANYCFILLLIMICF